MIKAGIYEALRYSKFFIPVLFICLSDLFSQVSLSRPILFDDFQYFSVEYPIEGDSSGSIFGKNPWLTDSGVIYTPAWRRFNRDNHQFGENAKIKIENYGFSLEIKKGFERKMLIPIIVSGFYFREGTFAAKIRFNKFNFDTKFIQAFWLTSPLYFVFQRGNETLRYWSEMDFEYNNYFTPDKIRSIQIGCNNSDGRRAIFTQIDCICKHEDNFYSYPKCNGDFNKFDILSGQWYICKFNLDSAEKTLKISMFCDSLSNSGAEVWGGHSSDSKNWGECFTIDDYFPEYTLTTVFSCHMGGENDIATDNSKLDVDWYYYSPKTDLTFEDIKEDIDSLKKNRIDRVNTTGQSTFPDANSFEKGIVSIDGPDSISSCQPYTWKLKSNYKRHASFDMDFYYRFIRDDGPENWVKLYRPDVTLTARYYHKSLELISSAFDYWGDYRTNDTMIVEIEQGNCKEDFKKYEISEPYPNPSLLTVQLDYELFADAHVTIKIFDLLGREITTLVEKHQTRGHYSEIFDAILSSSGTYVCTYKIGSDMVVKKIEIYRGQW